MRQSNSTLDHRAEEGQKKFVEYLQTIAYWGLAGLGGVILLGMVYYSFFYTVFMKQYWVDVPEERADQPLWNVAAAVALVLVLFAVFRLEKWLSDHGRRITEIGLVVFSACWILMWGLLWITGADRVPEGDPAFIYGGASYYLEGNYYFFDHGTYCQMYPQQLGQIAIVELFFLIVGTYNYFAIQVVCVLFATGIHLLGYGILRECKAGFAAKSLYCILMMGCIPLIFYTSWVYGDLPSTFFLYLVTLLALKLREKAKWQYVAGMTFAFMMAVLVRKNSYVFLVAFGILALLNLILKKRWRMIVAAVLFLAVGILSYRVVYAVYEHQAGVKIERGLPVNSWIAMGMEENWNGNGWYSDSPKAVGVDFDWDYDAVERYFSAYIRGRLEEFAENPKYALNFYKKKVTSQWNGPLYQCVYFSKNIPEDKKPAAGSFLDRLYHYGDAYETVLFWADRWQFLVYLGTFLYFLTNVRKKEEPMNFLFAVTVIGGFFFSILWEAKGRYCLPYYLMMYPLAVLGYEKMLGNGKRFFVRQ